MRKLVLFFVSALVVLTLVAQRGAAIGDTYVTAAADGVSAGPSSLSGLDIKGSSSTFGVIIYGDSTAEGDFETVLSGVGLLGATQYITVEGKVSAGTTNVDASVTFSGTATVDMGDGTVPLIGVPFSVTATTQGLQLVIGLTTLAPQTLTGGTITIQ